MTKDQEALLLTVARILRAKVRNEIYAEQEDDLWALNEALAPFDAKRGEPFSTISNAEYNGGDTPPI